MELPVVIAASRAWVAFFRCQLNPVRALMPPPLEPVTLRGGRAVAMVMALDCEDSSIGPFRQVAVGFAARHRPWFSLPLGSRWLERKVNDFGYWVEYSANSCQDMADAEQLHWGLPSFQAEVEVQLKRSRMRAVVREKGVEMMQFEMKRPGPAMPIHFPFRLYSRQEHEILRTEMSVDALGRERSLLISSHMQLHRHERVEKLRSVSIEFDTPLEARWYDSFRTRREAPSARLRLK